MEKKRLDRFFQSFKAVQLPHVPGTKGWILVIEWEENNNSEGLRALAGASGPASTL